MTLDLRQALNTYVDESLALLDEMEAALLALEDRPDDDELLAALFRSAHTIKGSAGLFALEPIIAFTHVVENVLDALRARRLAPAADLINILLACRDHVALLLEVCAVQGGLPGPEQAAAGAELMARLERHLRPAASTEAPDLWHVSVRFGRDVLRDGMDPVPFLRYLGTVAEIAQLSPLLDELPPLEELDPEACYLGCEIDLRGCAGKEPIEEVFEFVRASLRLRILPPPSHLARYMDRIERVGGDVRRLGEILIEAGVLTEAELDEALVMQGTAAPTAEDPVRLGSILVQEGMVQPEIVDVALDKQARLREQRGHETQFVRVNAQKLDQLINLVGELVIAGASAATLAKRDGGGALIEATAMVNRYVEALREDALRLRMVEIGETFQRFQRVVRDVGRELGKDIALEIRGADTELDKAVVEKIGDPLLHLVRNAIDHGIEAAEQRAARGKDPRGKLSLNAYHDSGCIVIEVGDDGAGLDRARILAKAQAQGLVAPGAVLTEREIDALVFAPGFSTAAQVTNLSGRGVGMDVVKRNIEALRGSVEIDSVPGQGSTMRIRLPLTLAIIDGFLIGVGKAAFVLPLDCVLECVELPATPPGVRYFDLRGQVLPYLSLREQFALGGAPARRQNIVVVQHAGRKAGLAVDQLMGEFQTVIKPLGRMFAQVRGIAGSTILGSGEVALILDVPALLQAAAAEADRPDAVPNNTN